MQKSKYQVYLDEFTERYCYLNVNYQKKQALINSKVAGIIKFYIKNHWVSMRDLHRYHFSIKRAFENDLESQLKADMQLLEQWESQRLVELFPELNNEKA